MQDDDVLAYLSEHPDFLQKHAGNFGLSPQRVVVPLAERQLLELRDQNRKLEARLAQLLRHGEANEQIIARSHVLTLTLLDATTLPQAIDRLLTCFEKEFGLSRVALRLWEPRAKAHASLWTSPGDGKVNRSLLQPHCGPYVNDEILGWFPPQPVLQSFAQLPLRLPGHEPFGLLVLASDDPERFSHNMHTQYLARIGELISAMLWRLL